MGKGGRKRRSFKSFGDTSEFNNVYARVAETALTGGETQDESPAEEPVSKETTEIKLPDEKTGVYSGSSEIEYIKEDKTPDADREDDIDTLEVPAQIQEEAISQEEKSDRDEEDIDKAEDALDISSSREEAGPTDRHQIAVPRKPRIDLDLGDEKDLSSPAKTRLMLDIPDTLIVPEAEETPPEPEAEVAESEARTEETTPEPEPFKTKLMLEEPRETAPEPEAEAAEPEARTEETAPEPEAEVAEPEARTEETSPEPEAEVAEPEAHIEETPPEPEAEAAEAEARTEETSPEPEAEVAEPEARTEETSPEPEPFKTKLMLEEPRETTPEPEAEAAKPEAHIEETAPEPEAEVAESEARTEETAPELEAEAAKPEAHIEETPPEPEAEAAKPEAHIEETPPEPEAEAAEAEARTEETSPELEAEVAEPEAEAAEPEARTEETAPEPEAEVAEPEARTEETSPEPEARKEETPPELEAEAAEPEARTEETPPEPEAEVAEPEARTEETTPELEDKITEDDVQWKPGQVIEGLYEIEEEAGTGIMGRLFSARHTRWDQPVIINLVDQRANAGGDPGRVIDACKNWIQAGAHPNISACFYAREIKGRVLVVYEKAPGVSLEEYFQNENIGSWRRALDLSIQILDALDYFHESGGIHGYLNFHSCMVHASGTLKLSHPGMISGFYGMDGTDETATIKSGKVYLFPGQLAGDPEYASPEVMLGTIDELGPWSDIYSIGAMLYRMLTGKLPTPVQGRTIEEIARDKTNKLPKNPVELEEDIPGPMADFILNCLDKERTVRPQSYSDARKKLEDIYCQLAEKEYTRTPPVRESFLPDSLNIQATALADLGRWQEAVGLWEEALTTRPGHIESIYNLGLTRWRHGLITDDTLVKILVDLIDSDPGHWMPRYLLGMVHMERCDHRAAGKVLKGLQETDNQRPQVEKINEYLKNNSRQTRRLARLFKGHTAPVFAVRINTEGTRILSGSMDKTLKVWDADNGKCLKTIEGHRGYVNAVDMSPDGKFAISGGGELISEDFDLKYWDLEKGTVIHDLQGHAGLIRSVALDTEKKLALSGGTDNLIKLWDLQKGSCIETLEGHQEWVNTLDFSPDGSYALSGCGTPRGSKDRTLRLWDLESKQCIRSLRGHTGSINTACFSRDGQFILSGSGNPGEQQDNTVRLWLASSGECLQQLSGHEGRINGVASGPDGRYALSCSEDKSLRIWDLETCQCIRTFVGVKGEINTLSISGDGSLAVTGCADSTLQLWEVNLGQEFFRAHHFLSIPNAQIIDISEDEYFEIGMSRARQAMAFQDYTAAAHWLREARSQKGKARDSKVMSRWVELYSRLQRKEPQGGWEIRTFETGQGSVGKVHFLGRKNLVVSGGQDGTVKIWNLTTGELAMTLDAGTGSQEGVRSISTTGDGSRLAVGNASSTGFTLWNLDTGKQDLKLDAFKNPGPLRVHFSPEGRLVFCASGQENSIKMFDAFDGRLLRKYEGHKMGINDFILSRDQQYILSASKDNTIKLWDLAGGRCVRTIKSKKLKGISSLCLSDNSRFALSASADNSIRLWDIENGKCIYIIKQLEYDVSSLHMSSDARYALTNYGDTLKMWDLSTGQILLSLEGHRGRVNSVLLSCDGRLALSGSDDGTIKHWLVDWSLEDRRPAEWDEGARTYLETFLELHTPFGAEIPGGDKINEKKLQAALVRRGKPTWTEEDFKELLHYLGCVGYGWLRPEGVRKELEKMSQESRESWLTKMINIFTREV